MSEEKSFNYEQYRSRFSEHELKHAPKELYYEGNTSLLTSGIRVSVVGSRKPSEDGVRRTRIFTLELVKRSIIVVSGLAEGIDTIAHTTAIENSGKTIAVLGTPLNIAYPSKNKLLLEKIKKNHLAISQFHAGYPAQRKNFPMRNRTMALISDATVIVEASENSGTKHQGWEALRLGRLVYIMQNLVENNSLLWPKEMINYGAQVLTREEMPDILDEIPSFTSSIDVELTF
jgi:DNA processing protein